MNKMTTNGRRYDIDWLRVIAIGLLLLYHTGIGFQPWGVFIGFIQSDRPLEALWIPMSMLNIWRIPLLFFVSGMGVCFAMRSRNLQQLLLERTRRILLPFLFGVVFIVPVHLFLWQKYYSQEITYSISRGHLWFLANIFIYVLILSPLFYFLRKNEHGAFRMILDRLFKKPHGLLVIVGTFILEAMLVNPGIYETYAMTLHGFILGFLAFFFGFCIIYSGDQIWANILEWRWLCLTGAVLLFLLRLFLFDLKAPNWLLAIESNLWIFALLGFASRYLNRPGKILSYLGQGAYPIYIIHMIFIYLASFIVMPLEIPAAVKFILVVIFTFTGCFVTYELIIKRVNIIRPLFGLKKVYLPEPEDTQK